MSAYKVWYIPQVPMPPFEVEVDSLDTARLILETLAQFSDFELVNNVKPDYCDAGGIATRDEDGEWIDVDPDEDES